MEGWTSEKAVYFPVLSCLFRIESGSETAATDTKPFFLSQDSFLLHRKAFFLLLRCTVELEELFLALPVNTLWHYQGILSKIYSENRPVW